MLAADVGALGAGADKKYWIVQLGGPVTEEAKENLLKAGAEVAGYLPENAFAVRADGATLERIAAVEGVHWIGAYHADYKVSPRLAKKLFEAKPEWIEVEVSTFTALETAGVAAQIAALGGAEISEIQNGEFGAIRAVVPADAVAQIAALGSSQWIAERVRPKLLNARAVEGPRLNVTNLWAEHGLNGTNQIVAVADTGLDMGSYTNMHRDFAGRVKVGYGLGRTGIWNDPDGHGTHVAGSVLGDGTSSTGRYKGVAWASTLVFQSLLDNGGGLGGIPPSLSNLFTPAYTNGARIHSDSWGASVYGDYTSDSQGVDSFVWSKTNMVILIAAGNEGYDLQDDGVVDEDSMSAPGTAKNCITVGAAENEQTFAESSGNYYGLFGFWGDPLYFDDTWNSYDGVHQGMAAFSSRGPCDDGRLKPDVVAPGTDIISTRSRATTDTGWGLVANTNYMLMGGTSMATPLLAGCVALYRQYLTERTIYTNPSAALIKCALMNAARSLYPGQYGTGAYLEIPAGPRPNNVEGWGQVDLERTIIPPAPLSMSFVDGVRLTTGATNTYFVKVATTNELRVTLCWSDYAASLAAAKHLVNDLDLVIVDPNGVTNRPRGMSVADRTNNVEGVDFATAVPGTYIVRVSGHNVPQGPQPYALVVRGAVVPDIQHTPLMKTTNTVSPYAVNANISAITTLDTNALNVFWRTNGSGSFTASPMAFVSNNTFRGFIPAQPFGSTIQYYIGATTSGLASTLPITAPSLYFQFSVADNIAPSFLASGVTVTNLELTTLIFTNAATDADIPANTLTYALFSGPVGMVVNPLNGVATWTPAENEGPSNTLVMMTVTDNGEPPRTVTNSFIVNVTEVNLPPTFPVVGTKTNIELRDVSITNLATDADLPGNSLTYALVSGPAGVAVSPDGVVTWSTDELDGPSTNLITMKATDNGVPPLSVTNTFTLIIKETNTPPVTYSVATQYITELESVTLTNLATDADLPTNKLTYSLVTFPFGMTIVSNAAILSWSPIETQGPTNQLVRIRISDGAGASVTSTFTIVVSEINEEPVPAATTNRTVAETTSLILTNRATDVDRPTNRLAYALLNAPAGMVINTNSAVITWTPPEDPNPSTNLITVVVTDNGTPQLASTNSFYVFVIKTNDAPDLYLASTQFIDELTTILFTNFSADSDLPTNNLTYSLLTPPTGAVIDAISGIVTWTPMETYGPSTTRITVAVTDNGVPPKMTTGRVAVVVREVNTAPTLLPIPDFTRITGQLLAFTNKSTDADLPTNKFTYSFVTAPTGATITAASGAIQWRPNSSFANTTNLFTIRSVDSGIPAMTSEVSFLVNVLPVHILEGSPAGDSGNLVFRWPANVPMQLETTTNLTKAGPWTILTNYTTVTNGNTAIITNTPTAVPQFYRIRAL